MPRIRPVPYELLRHTRRTKTYGWEITYSLRGKSRYCWHRTDGPAFVRRDCLEWWLNDNLHRVDGPARFPRGCAPEWWVHGQFIPSTEIERLGPDAAVMKALIRAQD